MELRDKCIAFINSSTDAELEAFLFNSDAEQNIQSLCEEWVSSTPKRCELIEKLGKIPILGHLVKEILTLYDIITDEVYMVEEEVVVLIMLGLGYFLTPADLIPDYLPIVGYLDDSKVLQWLIETLSTEIQKYRDFKVSCAINELYGLMLEEYNNRRNQTVG